MLEVRQIRCLGLFVGFALLKLRTRENTDTKELVSALVCLRVMCYTRFSLVNAREPLRRILWTAAVFCLHIHRRIANWRASLKQEKKEENPRVRKLSPLCAFWSKPRMWFLKVHKSSLCNVGHSYAQAGDRSATGALNYV